MGYDGGLPPPRLAPAILGVRALDRLIRVFFEILLLRKGPQDLPLAPFLLYLTLALHALSGFALALGVTDTALLALLTASLLYLQSRQSRLTQTLSALGGTGFLIALLAIVPTWWLAHEQGESAGATAGLPAFALLGLGPMVGAVAMWRLAPRLPEPPR